MAGRGEKGLLITTGTFTAEAKKEANRDRKLDARESRGPCGRPGSRTLSGRDRRDTRPREPTGGADQTTGFA